MTLQERIARPSEEIIRLAEIIYHADGFSERLGTIAEPPVWVAESLSADHLGDCVKVACTCPRCAAEEYVGIAIYVADRWPAGTPITNGEQG